MNPDKPLTQQQFIERLRDDLEIKASTQRVHVWIDLGMPIVESGGKKPRFHYPTAKAWILQAKSRDPLALKVRDTILKRRYKVPA